VKGYAAIRPSAASPAPVIVLGGGAQHRRFVRELRRRGHPLTLVDINPAAPCRPLADRFVQASIHDTEACHKALAPLVTDATRLVTFATGPAGRTCVELCHGFGLPARSRRLADATLDKRSLRCVLERAGLPVVREYTIQGKNAEAALKKVTFPALLKPARGGGGIDVDRLQTRDEAMARIGSLDLQLPHVLQPWIAGVERAIAVVVQAGRPVALLQGENILEASTGWPWPIGQALERRAPTDAAPAWLEIVPRLIEAFELVDDFVLVELISNDDGDYVIDVEMNALGPFACSEVMDDGDLIRTLVDTYLGEPVRAPERNRWIAGLAFVASHEEARVASLRGVERDTAEFRFDGTETWARLECHGSAVFKGGYVITKRARTLADARADALRFAARMLEPT